MENWEISQLENLIVVAGMMEHDDGIPQVVATTIDQACWEPPDQTRHFYDDCVQRALADLEIDDNYLHADKVKIEPEYLLAAKRNKSGAKWSKEMSGDGGRYRLHFNLLAGPKPIAK